MSDEDLKEVIHDLLATRAVEGEHFPSQPTTNDLRHIGRNDPCPCKSGKKCKKCCLN